MAINHDLKHTTALSALSALDGLDIDTSTVEQPLTEWDRIRDVRNTNAADPTALWAAIASGDQKAITKAATEYNVAATILQAAKDDTRREDTFMARTMSAVKALVLDAQDEARERFNNAAQDYTDAFEAAGNRPDPSQLIVTEGGAETWAALIQSAKRMDVALKVLMLAQEFGQGVKDQGTGLAQYLPYSTNLPTANAITIAAQTDWLNSPEHGPHKRYAAVLIAGADLYAGTIAEQEAEVERIIEGWEASRKTATIPQMIAREERRMAKATAKALGKGDA
ncbi:hypothetical protein [Brevibacterium sediminis]